MDCADEVAVLRRHLGPLVGDDTSLSFDLLKGRMSVAGAPGVTSDFVVAAVAKTGMRAEPWVDAPHGARALRRGVSRTVLTVASGCFTAAGFGLHVALAGSVSAALGSEGAGLRHAVPAPVQVTYALAIVAGIWFIVPRAWFAIRTFRPDMNLLMTIAVCGAIVIGEWFEAATVSFLFAVSLALERWSVGRARRAVEALLELAPDTVRLVVPDGYTEVPAAEATEGARFAVRPGERIPLDGRVVAGVSSVNQAPITGESVLVLKEPGVEVFAGTINGEGAIEVEATKSAGDSTLSHIIRLIDSAQSRRAPAEQWVERFARVYTPVVLASAITLALFTPLVTGDWSRWFYSALVLLVIGCPCALVISTPVSVVASLAAAARNGVLIKGGAFVEAPATIVAIALDKTGTLTEGRPTVVAVLPHSGHTEQQLVAIAAGLETHSDHPLAHAILAHAERAAVAPARVTDFTILPGKGATGVIDGVPYWLGSHRYLEERHQETPAVHAELERLSSTGRTVVVIGNADHVCGMIALADVIRPTTRNAVARLRALGVRHVVMLTGDNRPTAEAIANDAGITKVMAELLPADKVKAVESLAAKYSKVAMIGDGVNDAPAMARATLGIAMGAAGSDAAIETADVALMSDDLAKVPWLIQHSRRTLAIVRQNIAVSLGVKAVFVVLTLFGAASLWAAIASDMGVSLLVIANALRLLKIHA
ncbi:MAG: heavy metal translocating P-type ATPase [Acidobacteria bacterium]|nr:heavy metal translocating P-type ATPase [Acidobacteriota bacterium]